MKNVKLVFFLFLFTSIFHSCHVDSIEEINDENPNQELLDSQLEELEMMYEAEPRFALCGFESVIDENGCCVYNLPYISGYWYTIDGQFYSGGNLVICRGESISLNYYQSVPSNPSGFRRICAQRLTCTCCDEFELGYTAEYLEENSPFPGCCRFTLNFNNPACSSSELVLRGIIPNLGPNAYIASQQLNSIIVCGQMNGSTLELVAGIPIVGCVKREVVPINHCQ